MYSVFRHDQSRLTTPTQLVDPETAQCYLDCGFARRLSKWCLVLRKPLPLKLRDQSANIRPSVILAAAGGSRYHRAMIAAAWK